MLNFAGFNLEYLLWYNFQNLTLMKNVFYLLMMSFLLLQCKSLQSTTTSAEKPLTIAQDSLTYDVIIFDVGFESYLNTIAKPMNFYSQDYYELKNSLYVLSWNYRVRTSRQGHWSQVFESEIDYDSNINYGLEVNYKLYNYFKFIEYKYKIKIQ